MLVMSIWRVINREFLLSNVGSVFSTYESLYINSHGIIDTIYSLYSENKLNSLVFDGRR